MSNGPERAALLVCQFQAQNINISLALERELAEASLGPSSCPSSFPRALTIEHQRAQTPAKPHSVSVSAALGAHLELQRDPEYIVLLHPPPIVTSCRAAPPLRSRRVSPSIHHTGPPHAMVALSLLVGINWVFSFFKIQV